MSSDNKVLYQFPDRCGKPFRPANGTEGEMFMEAFCYQCIHERWTHRMKEDRDEDKCDTMSRSILYDLEDKEYPNEWVFNSEGWPVCTRWKKFDWGSGDDPREPPPPPPPEDPMQLLMPFSMADLMGTLWDDGEMIITKHGIIEREMVEILYTPTVDHP